MADNNNNENQPSSSIFGSFSFDAPKPAAVDAAQPQAES